MEQIHTVIVHRKNFHGAEFQRKIARSGSRDKQVEDKVYCRHRFKCECNR